MDEKMSYEENLEALEKRVKQLQEGEIPLEESFKIYQEALDYYDKCRKILNDLEGKLEEYKEDTDSYQALEIGEES